MSNKMFLMIRKVVLMVLVIMPVTAYSWTFDSDFEDETVGLKTNKFTDAAGGSIVSTDTSTSGSKSIKLNISQGSEGFGMWGGRKNFPVVGEGDEVWVRLKTKIPSDFDLTTNIGTLKFLRLHVQSSANAHIGYVDIYMNWDGSFKYQNELYTTNRLVLLNQSGTYTVNEIVTGQTTGATARVKAIKTSGALVFDYTGSTQFSRYERITGGSSGASATLEWVQSNSVTDFASSNKVQRDVWETYIYRVRFSASRPLVQFYKAVGSTYVLLFEDASDYTLKSPTDTVDAFLLFTYWNGSSPRTQHMYVDDLLISTEPPPEMGTRPKSVIQAPAS